MPVIFDQYDWLLPLYGMDVEMQKLSKHRSRQSSRFCKVQQADLDGKLKGLTVEERVLKGRMSDEAKKLIQKTEKRNRGLTASHTRNDRDANKSTSVRRYQSANYLKDTTRCSSTSKLDSHKVNDAEIPPPERRKSRSERRISVADRNLLAGSIRQEPSVPRVSSVHRTSICSSARSAVQRFDHLDPLKPDHNSLTTDDQSTPHFEEFSISVVGRRRGSSGHYEFSTGDPSYRKSRSRSPMLSHSEIRQSSPNNRSPSLNTSGRQSPLSPSGRDSSTGSTLELPAIHGSSRDKRRKSFNLEDTIREKSSTLQISNPAPRRRSFQDIQPLQVQESESDNDDDDDDDDGEAYKNRPRALSVAEQFAQVENCRYLRRSSNQKRKEDDELTTSEIFNNLKCDVIITNHD